MKRLIIFTCITILLIVYIGFAGTIDLPMTGLTKCYDGQGAEIACIATSQDGDIRAGAAWPHPRFTVGEGVEADCVTDNLTGLMWSKNANLPDGGRKWSEALDYVTVINSGSGLCGHKDWRLPNITELESLIDISKSVPALPADYPFTGVQSAWYWSSTSGSSCPDHAWILSVGLGNLNSGNKMYDYFVWPVRSGQSSGTVRLPRTGQGRSYDVARNGEDGDIQAGAQWPNPRFAVGTGAEADCILDNLTGLVWTKNANLPNRTKTWQQALDYAVSLNGIEFCGYTDWRLPDRKELLSLIDRSKDNPILPADNPFTDVQSTWYWSSSSNATAADQAWIVDVHDGFVDNGSKTSDFYAWPVRTGLAGNLINLLVSKAGSGNGTVTGAGNLINCGTDCLQSYLPGTSREITLTAAADPGSIFTGWSDDCSGTDNQVTITLNSSRLCTAAFIPSFVTIKATGAGLNGGTIAGSGDSPIINATWNGTAMDGDNTETVHSGTGPYTITATANTGGNVTWSGDCNATSGNGSGLATCTIGAGITANKNIIATFAINNYAVTANAGTNGTVTCTSPVNYNSSSTCSIIPAAGYRLFSLADNGLSVGASVAGNAYTINNVKENHAVEAIFEVDATPPEKFILTVIKSGSGTVTGGTSGMDCGEDCTGTYESGTEIELIAVPDAGMVLADWSVPGCMNTVNTCTVKMDDDIEIAVTFVPAKSRKYSLKVSAQKGGMVTSNDGNIHCDAASKSRVYKGAEQYYGGTVILTAEPAEGYTFTKWTGCTTKNGSTCTVTMKKNTVITAKFRALKKYILKVVAGKGGTVTSDDGNINCNGIEKNATCSAKYLEGSGKVVTLTASSAAGRVFTGWSGGGCSGKDTCTVTMSAGKTVTAKFKKQK